MREKYRLMYDIKQTDLNNNLRLMKVLEVSTT